MHLVASIHLSVCVCLSSPGSKGFADVLGLSWQQRVCGCAWSLLAAKGLRMCLVSPGSKGFADVLGKLFRIA